MEPVLTEIMFELLVDAKKIFAQHEIDYFIVGAIARDIHLAKNNGAPATRRTDDLDLAILIPDEQMYEEVKADLIATGLFSA